LVVTAAGYGLGITDRIKINPMSPTPHAKPRAYSSIHRQLPIDEVTLRLCEGEILPVRWALHGLVITELCREWWARAEILRVVMTYGAEPAHPLADRSGFGIKCYVPRKGWMYLNTRTQKRRRGKR
jgi:hypothetical protein